MADVKTILDGVLENPALLQKLKMIGKDGGYRKYLTRNPTSPGDLAVSPAEINSLRRVGAIEYKGGKYRTTPYVNAFIEAQGPVNVTPEGNVLRYHATNAKGLNGIYNFGYIAPMENRRTYVRDKFGNPIKDDSGWGFKMREYTRPVFTSTESWADEWDRPIAMTLNIPVEEYKAMRRGLYNPDHSPYDYREYIMSVDRGGTSDFIEDKIPIKYVKEICLDPDRTRCYDTSKVPFMDVVDILNGVEKE